MPVEPRNIEETDDTRRNPKGYNALLQLVSLWYIRLEHLGLNLFKKTIKIINSISNLNTIKEKDFVYLIYNRNKAVKKLNLKVLPDPLKILNTLERDTFKIKPKPYNKRVIKLFIIDCKSQFKWMIFLLNCQNRQFSTLSKACLTALKTVVIDILPNFISTVATKSTAFYKPSFKRLASSLTLRPPIFTNKTA